MIIKCETCGSEVQKYPYEIRAHNFCSRACFQVWNRPRMSEYNRTDNPLNKVGGATPIIREKLRAAKLKESVVSYKKLYGRHEHRVIAEKMLNRPLQKGEVVHHINCIRSDNRPENLNVFDSQREHAKFHALAVKGGGKK